jgi:hypothetical protein
MKVLHTEQIFFRVTNLFLPFSSLYAFSSPFLSIFRSLRFIGTGLGGAEDAEVARLRLVALPHSLARLSTSSRLLLSRCMEQY